MKTIAQENTSLDTDAKAEDGKTHSSSAPVAAEQSSPSTTHPAAQGGSRRATMGGKPVFTRPAKSVINFDSGFKQKLLCDGPTFTMGDSCVYSCSFCFVADMMTKARAKGGFLSHIPAELEHAGFVSRRDGAVECLREQLTTRLKGGGRKAKFDNANDNRVIYSSPLVDCAANMDLVRETVEACKVILELTNWHIRLLSKSNLLPKLAQELIKTTRAPGWEDAVRRRLIFGVSTGTLDDAQAAAFEQGCPKVSKRIESLHWLQDEGFRTFGMICPSLPQRDYPTWAAEMALAIRAHRCEHVWAEVMNPRGAAMPQTVAALHAAGYEWQAQQLDLVSKDKSAWEDYARQTFLAHVLNYSNAHGPGVSRLRYLQYVNKSNAAWWSFHIAEGAVLL